MREGRLTRERDPVESPWVEPEMGKGKVCVLSGIEVMGRCNNNNRNRENRGIEKQRKQGNRENREMMNKVLGDKKVNAWEQREKSEKVKGVRLRVRE